MKTLTIRMKAGDVAEVLLYDEIGADPFFGGISAKDFREQIKAVKAKTINLRINSPGGSVFEASAMMAALDEFNGRIEVDVDGLAASAASVVAMAGDEIRMASGAMMMIHDPHAFVIGGAEDMRSTADILDKAKEQLLDAYERHSDVGRKKLSDWMSAESWFTGQEAIDAGLADSITEGRQVAAFANLKAVAAKLHFKRLPEALLKPIQDERAWRETERRRTLAASL